VRIGAKREAARAGLRRFMWNALVRLYPPVALAVGAPAGICLQTLTSAARPSTQRLHLRDLFMEGRRYYITPTTQGFRMTSDHRPMWARRGQRSRVAAYVVGTFTGLQGDDGITLVRLRARMYTLYTLSAFLVPTFFTSILIYMPWHRVIIVAIIVMMFTSSWLGHRMNAAMQVNEMIYFVQKAFEDLPPVEVKELPIHEADVVMPPSDFMAEWARFYRMHSEEEGREDSGI